ncbi:hypothetical protein NPIL_511791 [Nephila pilipes]|uniref:Uncharacterized protein n=1 Tax=Nephila pilipes TaxID=299642 RepID=A0A8X6R4V1_NEPPI|nr:hypothetical protein NPIL_511791 [Nephila pilipes]
MTRTRKSTEELLASSSNLIMIKSKPKSCVLYLCSGKIRILDGEIIQVFLKIIKRKPCLRILIYLNL